MRGEWRWKLIPNWSLCWGGHGPCAWSLCLWFWSALRQAIPGWSWAEAGHTSEQSQDLAFLSAWHRERNHHLRHIVLRWLVKRNPRCCAKARREVVRVRRKPLQVPHESQRPHLQCQSGSQMLSSPQSKAVAPRVPPKNEIRHGCQLLIPWLLTLAQCCSKSISHTSSVPPLVAFSHLLFPLQSASVPTYRFNGFLPPIFSSPGKSYPILSVPPSVQGVPSFVFTWSYGVRLCPL